MITYIFVATRTFKLQEGEGIPVILLPVAARFWLPGETRQSIPNSKCRNTALRCFRNHHIPLVPGGTGE